MEKCEKAIRQNTVDIFGERSQSDLTVYTQSMMRRSARLSSTLSPQTTTALPPTKKPSSPCTSTSKSAKSQPPIKSFASPSAFETYISAAPSAAGIWLICSKKCNPVQTVTYDQALDIALCHGWIDGQRKTHDALNFIQRFTPRREGSIWSKRNVEKVAVLISEGKMREGGLREVELAKRDGRWERAYGGSGMEVPEDLGRALGSEGKKKLEGLDKGTRFAYLFKVVTAKTAESRKKWIGVVVDDMNKL